MQIVEEQTWDKAFFEKFIQFKNDLYQNIAYHQKETLEQLQDQLNSSFFKEEDIRYVAMLFIEDKITQARVIAYYSKTYGQVLYFGYLETVNNTLVWDAIFAQLKKLSYQHELTKIRGPFQGNFFFSYRHKIWGEQPFYSEPYALSYYNQIFDSWGMYLYKTWFTSKLDILKTAQNFSKIRKASAKKNKSFNQLKVHFLFPWRFNRSMKVVYELFLKTYSQMSDFSSLDFETFYSQYKGFKYLLNPFFSYLVSYQGEYVGFCINFFDPLNILLGYQSKKCSKFKLLLKLALNRKRLLIMYVGKDINVSGVQSLISKYLYIFIKLFRVKDIFVCFSASDSPANKSFRKENQSVIAEYGMYEVSVR